MSILTIFKISQIPNLCSTYMHALYMCTMLFSSDSVQKKFHGKCTKTNICKYLVIKMHPHVHHITNRFNSIPSKKCMKIH